MATEVKSPFSRRHVSIPSASLKIDPLVDATARHSFHLEQPPSTTPEPPEHLVTEAERIENAKKLAAFAAVDQYITSNTRVVGVGSGSTVPYMIDRIVAQGAEVNRSRWFLPTSFQSKELIVKGGLNLGDVDQFPSVDVTIDGADEVDDRLNAIKGGGACLLREKVLAEAADVWVLVADSRKDSEVLGTKWKQGVPIEVVPFAWSKVHINLRNLGSTAPVLRMGKAKAGPVVTDNANFIIDAPFPPEMMSDPVKLAYEIKMITGVVEVGLFVDMAKAAYFGNADGSVVLREPSGEKRLVVQPTKS